MSEKPIDLVQELRDRAVGQPRLTDEQLNELEFRVAVVLGAQFADDVDPAVRATAKLGREAVAFVPRLLAEVRAGRTPVVLGRHGDPSPAELEQLRAAIVAFGKEGGVILPLGNRLHALAERLRDDDDHRPILVDGAWVCSCGAESGDWQTIEHDETCLWVQAKRALGEMP